MKSIRLILGFDIEEKFNLWERGKLGNIGSERQLQRPGFEFVVHLIWALKDKKRKNHKKSCSKMDIAILISSKPSSRAAGLGTYICTKKMNFAQLLIKF